MRIKAIEIDNETADVLRRGEWSGTLYLLPNEKLDRKLYEKVDKVLRALGGKWNRSLRGHVFTVEGCVELSDALEAGRVVDIKRTHEQFFTPPELAQRMCEELEIAAGMHVLEPSAGSGRIVRAAMDAGANLFTLVELDDRLASGLVDLIGHHSGGVWAGDFMAWTPKAAAPIDAALMNPPFSGNQDIAHVTRAFDFLRPGGKLAAIMSPHFTFAQDGASKDFRMLIDYPQGRPYGRVASASVELLPAGTFKAEGTNVSAVLVLIEKAA